VAGEGFVDIGHIGGVVLAVVNLHGLRVNVRFKRILGVWKGR